MAYYITATSIGGNEYYRNCLKDKERAVQTFEKILEKCNH